MADPGHLRQRRDDDGDDREGRDDRPGGIRDPASLHERHQHDGDGGEPGADGWTLAGLSTDPHRWQIVNDTDLNGAAHSRTHAWRFGYVSTLLPSLFPPEWHTLTSPAIPIDPGPAFLIFSQRYDLTGRTVPVLPVGSNDTDDAYIEVRYNGGPWTPLAPYTPPDLTRRALSFNPTAP